MTKHRGLMVAAAVAASIGVATSASASSVSLRDVSVDNGELTVVVDGLAGVPDTATVEIGGHTMPATVDQLAAVDASADRTVVLVVDTSESMTPAGLDRARSTILGFAEDAPASMRIGLVGFAQRAQLLVSPTSDRARLSTAVEALTVSTGTRLYDALLLGLDAAAPATRPSMVVITDGSDTASTHSLSDVLAAERSSDTTVDVLAVGDVPASDSAVQQAIATAGKGESYAFATPKNAAGVFGHLARAAGTELLLTADMPTGVHGDAEVRVIVGGVTAMTVVTLPTPATVTDDAPFWRDTTLLVIVATAVLGVAALGGGLHRYRHSCGARGTVKTS